MPLSATQRKEHPIVPFLTTILQSFRGRVGRAVVAALLVAMAYELKFFIRCAGGHSYRLLGGSVLHCRFQVLGSTYCEGDMSLAFGDMRSLPLVEEC